MTRKEILTYALRDAIDWEITFLDAIKNCRDESNNDARQFANDLLIGYRKELKRITKSEVPYPAPLSNKYTIDICEALRQMKEKPQHVTFEVTKDWRNQESAKDRK